MRDISDLAEAVAASAAQGLDPSDYDVAAVEAAARAGDVRLDALADGVAISLAHDFREGRTTTPDWHFPPARLDYREWLGGSLARHRLVGDLAGLLPTSAGYAALGRALADCGPAPEACRRIGVNLDRWRRLPRSFGRRYLWVNVPAMRADLIEDGAVVASHRVIIGKPRSRTPFFSAAVTGVTVNPWWNVPCSIVDESVGKLVRTRPREAARQGYVASRSASGTLVVRQKPGPDNALGRIKLEMPNPYGVYLHDTPSRDLFSRDDRALSHGCIRTEGVDVLAKRLAGPGGAEQIDRLLLTGASRTISLPAAVPVYVVYLTAEGGSAPADPVRTYADVYHLDSAAAALPRAASK